jgi:hypothetical protein
MSPPLTSATLAKRKNAGDPILFAAARPFVLLNLCGRCAAFCVNILG